MGRLSRRTRGRETLATRIRHDSHRLVYVRSEPAGEYEYRVRQVYRCRYHLRGHRHRGRRHATARLSQWRPRHVANVETRSRSACGRRSHLEGHVPSVVACRCSPEILASRAQHIRKLRSEFVICLSSADNLMGQPKHGAITPRRASVPLVAPAREVIDRLGSSEYRPAGQPHTTRFCRGRNTFFPPPGRSLFRQLSYAVPGLNAHPRFGRRWSLLTASRCKRGTFFP